MQEIIAHKSLLVYSRSILSILHSCGKNSFFKGQCNLTLALVGIQAGVTFNLQILFHLM